MFDKNNQTQSQVTGDHSILIQAGRDINLIIRKSPPNIKLVRVSIEDDYSDKGIKQKLNLVLKNNGESSAVLLSGHLIVEKKETIKNCNEVFTQFMLMRSDWNYDVDVEEANPNFTGKHALAPNEVISFDVSVGRKTGGHQVTVYRSRLRLKFDEGLDLETEHFFLRISGPTYVAGSMTPSGLTSEMWGKCMADNIRRLDKIGYDFRPYIEASAKKYIVEAAPDLFSQQA
jgi:hypothetical protein